MAESEREVYADIAEFEYQADAIDSEEPDEVPEAEVLSEMQSALQEISDDDFALRIKRRRAKARNRRLRRRAAVILGVLILFMSLAVAFMKDIVRLKAENAALKKQHQELIKERDKLKEEVRNSGDKEYLQNQARKQLRLLNPGEILFTFDDETEEEGN